MSIPPAKLASAIDHALLHPALTPRQLADGLQEVRIYPLASVCIKPSAVLLARQILQGTSIAVCTVAGFPHGTSLTAVKTLEAELALQQGAAEIDMVIHPGMALAGEWARVEEDIFSLRKVTSEAGALLKVIFENVYLQDDQKRELCRICTAAGADFVKTSTGFGYVPAAAGGFAAGGAVEHDLRLMRSLVPPGMGVKASGGIRTLQDAENCLLWGANRLGMSATKAVLQQAAVEFAGRE